MSMIVMRVSQMNLLILLPHFLSDQSSLCCQCAQRAADDVEGRVLLSHDHLLLFLLPVIRLMRSSCVLAVALCVASFHIISVGERV